jgi:acetylornithine deacetylase/succinyl-diaminopimelate desuccinylase-like protein
MSFEDIADFPKRVAGLIDGVSDTKKKPSPGEWAIVENVCHLRDIEAEGYAVRIEQLLRENDPLLRDLDGEKLAIERRYIDDDCGAALRAFADARARSVAMLRDANEDAFAREGTLENVGRVSLATIVSKMREHDAGHLRDIALLVALDRFAQQRDEFRADLEELCRIPGVSASDPKEVRRSAEATARLLDKHGVANVRLLEVENAHPSVFGSIDVDPQLPTLLIYGHHDVQPVGKIDRWTTPPFEPVERDGRLYGRGTSDDKGGVLAHVAAAASYRGKPPCNLKFFIEGEEEIGSPNLGQFLERYGDLLRADAVVLADTPNADTGIPALTQSLRGLCVVEIEVRTLERPLHSGRGGGAAPDAIAILCQLIASLDCGSYAAAFSTPKLHRDLGLLEGVALTGTREQTWNEPAIAVIGFDAPPVEQSFNQLAASARARLSIRTVPPRESREFGEEIIAKLNAIPMPHALVSAKIVKSVPWWRTDATGPVFDAARRALTRGYGRDVEMIGTGGSIGFVGTFESAFAGTPLLLMGVEDPPCNAHSENESLHLGDWESCVRASIFLYDELRRALR